MQLQSELDEQYLIIKGKNSTWYRPTKFRTLLALKDQYPNAKIVVGYTEIGLYIFSYRDMKNNHINHMIITKSNYYVI
jgi:xanthine dehydrogenase iron-sulfur cluster and FAD-binding subunit A